MATYSILEIRDYAWMLQASYLGTRLFLCVTIK